MRHNMTAIDLFCGAGGLSEGFRQAGFDVLAGQDFDAQAGPPSPVRTRGPPSLAGRFRMSVPSSYSWPPEKNAASM